MTTAPAPTTLSAPTTTPPSTAAPAPNCKVTYTKHAQWPRGFTTQVTVKNTGSTAINGWTLRWSFLGGQSVTDAWSVAAAQSGATVSATNLSWNKVIAPGASVTFGFNGDVATGPNPDPALFTLNGRACS